MRLNYWSRATRPEGIQIGSSKDPCKFDKGSRTDTVTEALARFILRQYRNYNRFARGPEKDPEYDLAACSGLRTLLRSEDGVFMSRFRYGTCCSRRVKVICGLISIVLPATTTSERFLSAEIHYITLTWLVQNNGFLTAALHVTSIYIAPEEPLLPS